jgi:UDPglucose 6-dehydrogenase
MKIVNAVTGYVGPSSAMLLAQHDDVIALDLLEEKVELLNNTQWPIVDKKQRSLRK